ncbi:MAG: hemerythrin domain-containing protein [Rickettsiales bacterium]
MDIYAYLQKDHRHVSELMEKLLSARSKTRRKAIFDEICSELTLHAETEEATFYKALEKKSQTEEKMEHAHEEHDEIREYMDKLDVISMESEKWIETFGEFKHAVEHHVHEEEESIFKKAKSILNHAQAVQLAKDMDALKKKHLKTAA